MLGFYLMDDWGPSQIPGAMIPRTNRSQYSVTLNTSTLLPSHPNYPAKVTVTFASLYGAMMVAAIVNLL